MRRVLAIGAMGVCLPLASSCAGLVSSVAADTLSAAILNQDDPVLVASGLPAYLLLVDGLISQHPDSESLLAAGAQLFALYGARFEPNATRAAQLTLKGRVYGKQAMCLVHEPACRWDGLSFDAFVAELSAVDDKKVPYLYAYAVSWLSHLDATSNDWGAVAELPWVQAVLERVLDMDETYEQGAVHGYLGILYALRPPALGGKPELARAHFERAIELSGGHDLSLKVEFARRYARLVFDQELHDRLLHEVVSAPTDSPGYTLFNTLAQQEAAELLESSREYF
jgi:hypothetical protein